MKWRILPLTLCFLVLSILTNAQVGGPEWQVEPQNQLVPCNESTVNYKFNLWLRNHVATSSCTPVDVANSIKNLEVISPSDMSGPYNAYSAVFGPQMFDVTGNLQLATDADNSLCCGALVGFVPGNIAVIDRGVCTFVQKVFNAQNAGAIGVIICNNVDGAPSEMGGDNPSITIPVLMISKSDGIILRNRLISESILAKMHREQPAFNCTGLPYSVDVTFYAVDACRNVLSKTVSFSVVENDPPEWTVPPSDIVFTCDSILNETNIYNWLTTVSATGNCEPTRVTNNYCYLNVSEPFSISGIKFASWGNFGRKGVGMTSEIEIATDGINSYCCNPLVGFTPGNIAVIDRGMCSFVTKARNAQNAGAIALIICTYSNTSPSLMVDDGTGSDIKIPVIMISWADGISLKNALELQTVRGVVYVAAHHKSFCEPLEVTFTATDTCGNSVSESAYATAEQVAPNWIVEPENLEEVCNENLNNNKLFAWLLEPKAENPCSEANVTNNFCRASVLGIPNSNGHFFTSWADFGAQSFDVSGLLTFYDSGDNLACSSTSRDFTNKIVLISRGTCSFVSKVRNAQNNGAIGVLIYNNSAGVKPSLMADDGTGSDITIPVLMISKEDGDYLKEFLRYGYILEANLMKKPFEANCSDLPRDYPVNFMAENICGSLTEKSATFTLMNNNIPAWINYPEPLTLACDENGNDNELWEWLNEPTAQSNDVNCGNAKVTNSFSYLYINSPVASSKDMLSGWALFGPNYFHVTSNVEIAYDFDNNLCCNDIVGFTPGNIALIERGYCSFVSKVRHAQAAGAIAVIITNQYDNYPPMLMGDDGTSVDITIPVLMISKEDGAYIRELIALGKTVNVAMHKEKSQFSCSSVIESIVKFTATDECGNYLSESSSFAIYPMFTLTTEVDNPYMLEPGGLVMYTTTVTNISPNELDIIVEDTNGRIFAVFGLDPGGLASYSYLQELTEAGLYYNIATATSTAPNGEIVSKTAYTTVYIEDVQSDVVLTKLVDKSEACYPEKKLTWYVHLENRGPETIQAHLTDDNGMLNEEITLPGFADFLYTYYTQHLTPDGYKSVINNAYATINDHESVYTLVSMAEGKVYGPVEVYSATLQTSPSADGPPWNQSVNGNLDVGYQLCLNPDEDTYYLDVDQLVSSSTLLAGTFYLNSCTNPTEFFDYWAARGVTDGHPFGTKEHAIWNIINGNLPIAYLENSNNDYRLIDGVGYYLSSLEGPPLHPTLQIPGDLPSGEYTLAGWVMNENYCKSDTFYFTFTINQEVRITKHPNHAIACQGEVIPLMVETTGNVEIYQWYKNGEPILGATSNSLMLGPVTINDAGDYHVEVKGLCNTIESAKAHISIMDISVDPIVQQYSDPVTFTATIYNGAWLSSELGFVGFYIEDLFMGSASLTTSGTNLNATLSNVPLLESNPPTGKLAPGIKSVSAIFYKNNSEEFGCKPKCALEIKPEKAILDYNGMEMQATASANYSKATVEMLVVIHDYDDGWPGDIRNACVTLKIMEEPGGILVKEVTLPVCKLIVPGDISTGIVTYNFEVDLGSADYKTYTLKMIADCYYMGCRSVVITVYKPVGDFITGGGNIITDNSFGLKAGAPNTTTNFGFHVKFNKKNTNLIGGMNLIYRRMISGELNEFQIKSNAMSKLGVNVTNPDAKTANFTSKANLYNLTTGIEIEGNLQLIATLTDKGEPGVHNDQIGFTLWKENKKGTPSTLIYSSSWNGSKTLEWPLDGGNLVVHTGLNLKSVSPFESDTDEILMYGLKVYPNPFHEVLNLEMIWHEDAHALVEIYDVRGAKIANIFEGYVHADEIQRVEYRPVNLVSGLLFYRLTFGNEIQYGKILYMP